MRKRLILVVDDEPAIVRLVRAKLQADGYGVITADNGPSAIELFDRERPDLVVLDLMMPGMDGFETLRRLHRFASTPVIMLTARGEESERVRGLATGADDYVVKPFSVPELVARVRALMRRASPERVASLLEAGDIALDRETRRVRRGGRELHCGPTEFRMLEFLMEKPGRVFTRAQLLDGVWGLDAELDERTVDVHVGRLRKVLNRPRDKDPIRTVRGAGYSFDETFAKKG